MLYTKKRPLKHNCNVLLLLLNILVYSTLQFILDVEFSHCFIWLEQYKFLTIPVLITCYYSLVISTVRFVRKAIPILKKKKKKSPRTEFLTMYETHHNSLVKYSDIHIAPFLMCLLVILIVLDKCAMFSFVLTAKPGIIPLLVSQYMLSSQACSSQLLLHKTLDLQ